MTQMTTSSTSVSREQLYEEIWKAPGTQLAQKYGVSDVAIGKACRRHDIPRPPPGFWTLLKHGYDVERTPLPPVSDPRLAMIEFHPVPPLPGRGAGSEEGNPGHGPICVAENSNRLIHWWKQRENSCGQPRPTTTGLYLRTRKPH